MTELETDIIQCASELRLKIEKLQLDLGENEGMLHCCDKILRNMEHRRTKIDTFQKEINDQLDFIDKKKVEARALHAQKKTSKEVMEGAIKELGEMEKIAKKHQASLNV